jgi:hypothetical protein
MYLYQFSLSRSGSLAVDRQYEKVIKNPSSMTSSGVYIGKNLSLPPWGELEREREKEKEKGGKCRRERKKGEKVRKRKEKEKMGSKGGTKNAK